MILNSKYTFAERLIIKNKYKECNLKNYLNFGRNSVNFKFSTIEFIVWSEIKCIYECRNFVPEYPILNYFVDFADPINKIVFECDSEKYHHDKIKDEIRQKNIEKLGWKIFRFNSRQILSNIYSELLLTISENDYLQDEIDYNSKNCISCFLRSSKFKKIFL